jgi:hypothetical protein
LTLVEVTPLPALLVLCLVGSVALMLVLTVRVVVGTTLI